ncbi:MAG: class I SAM-dependent methyltransferase [Pelolinea sp.]|nr:class I SAM-dependent methyltransferase [Pelolinea sp.]
MKKERNIQPTAHDLEVWQYAQEELFNYLYKGLAGWFQIQGHRVLGKWSISQQTKHVLEIGCGQGHHVIYSGHTYQNYIGLEIRYDFIEAFKKRESAAMAINGDAFCMPFEDHSIDCILSIYIFEHLNELKSNLLEIKRVLKKDGKLLVALPSEGGFLYKLGRALTSKRYMEKKFGFNYDAIIRYEHVNQYPEIIRVIREVFPITQRRYIPFPFLPSYHLNAVVCLQSENRWLGSA